MNQYLLKFASQDIKRKLACVCVLVSNNNPKALGYYSLSAGSIELDSLPEDMQEHLPQYFIPIARIGRLAIDISMQGKHLGEEILLNALHRCKKLSEELGIFAVLVDAKHEQAKNFYLQYGFTELSSDPFCLCLMIKTIEAMY